MIEAVLTFFLVWVIFATAVDPRGTSRQIAGLAIGLTITLDILFAGGLTGARNEPGASVRPQLAVNHWTNFWVWYVGPFCGGVIAAVVYDLLYLRHIDEFASVGTADSGIAEAAPGEAAGI